MVQTATRPATIIIRQCCNNNKCNRLARRFEDKDIVITPERHASGIIQYKRCSIKAIRSNKRNNRHTIRNQCRNQWWWTSIKFLWIYQLVDMIMPCSLPQLPILQGLTFQFVQDIQPPPIYHHAKWVPYCFDVESFIHALYSHLRFRCKCTACINNLSSHNILRVLQHINRHNQSAFHRTTVTINPITIIRFRSICSHTETDWW